MDVLANLASYFFIDILLITLGRLALAVLTLGRWRGEAIGDQEGRIHSRAGALSFVRDGQRVLTRTGLEFLGFVTLLAGIVAAVVW